MSNLTISQAFTLLSVDNHRLSNFCGQFDAHFRQIEQHLKVEIANRGNQFKVTGFAEGRNHLLSFSCCKASDEQYEKKHG